MTGVSSGGGGGVGNNDLPGIFTFTFSSRSNAYAKKYQEIKRTI